MLEKFFNRSLFDDNDRILLAFSGGADSTACLYLLKQLFPQASISALYLNHGLRREADKEVIFCRKICKNLKVNFFSKKIEVRLTAKKIKKSLEETGRILRYKELLRTARKLKANIIVTAHHADDQAESILFQYLTGTTGLKLGILETMFIEDSEGPVRVVRPLLKAFKQDIYDYLESHKISYVVDKTNYETDFKRNKLRNIIIPMIKNNFSPALEKVLITNKEISDEISDFVDTSAEQALKNIIVESEGFDLLKFRKIHPYIRKEIIKKILLKHPQYNGRINSNLLEDISAFLLSPTPNREYSLINNMILSKSYKHFLLTTKEQRKKQHKYPLKYGQNFCGDFCITIAKATEPVIDKNNKATVYMDIEKVNISSLYCRYRMPGDIFIPLGMKKSKKVKDFFIDRKVPLRQRENIPIICDSKQIIWIVNQEIDDRVKITEKSKSFLKITVNR
ncbi:MAG: tRNA lysidine(34) synthetase TilS [Candidatus Margulisbacteria bacterium]|nr:tRNA lysidine(34) synthetase TilS [Candidatus Margulisiibacteriota bacterium]